MSTIKSFGHLDFTSTGKPGFSLSGFGKALQTYWSAFVEGLGAARTYNELTRRGVPHAVAVKAIFDGHFVG